MYYTIASFQLNKKLQLNQLFCTERQFTQLKIPSEKLGVLIHGCIIEKLYLLLW